MCGIAGYFGTAKLDDARVKRCLSLMGRRGPDAAACKVFENESGRNTYLLHSRLSIIDVDERANQPFAIDAHWTAFNGEIYNFVELRQNLQAEGHSFRTQSDTEVLLTAIIYKGLDVLDQFEGMWAAAIYNERTGNLTLTRDRFGEKPLFIHHAPDGIYFGSEAKFIFALLGKTLPINYRQVSRFLVNGYKSIYKGKDTFFEGLGELRPATNLSIDAAGRISENCYWRPAFKPLDQMTYQQAVEGCRSQLIEAVRLRLRSDVPMAFLMSGGVDSNAIIGIAKRVFDYDVHGFTIINDDERYDEKAIVEGSVASLGIKHTALPIRRTDFLERLRRQVRYHDAPVFTITYYLQWLLMEQISKAGYKVAFSGTGADEIMSGYYDHHLMYLSEVKGTSHYDSAVAAWKKHVKPEVRNPFLSNPTLFDENSSFRDHIYLNNHEFSEYLFNYKCEQFSETVYDSSSLLRNRMMNEMFNEGVPVILHEDDLNAMYFSIENRSPFLDRKLFEFCYSIPTRHLIQDGFNKSVLRDAMRGIAPDCVIDQRRKVGFNAPVLDFLDAQDPIVIDELMAESPVFDVIRRDKIEAILQKGDLPNSGSKFLFNFVSVKMFLEEFSGKETIR